MLHSGAIEPAQSIWASPVVLFLTLDRLWRFCIDYRWLSSATVKHVYTIPRMDEHIDSLGSANMFTTLDAYSSYWRVPIRKQDPDKTAFV